MKILTRKHSVLITLFFFACSLFLSGQFKPETPNNLHSVIFQVQQLQNVADSETADFKIVFTNIISTLQGSADLDTLTSDQFNPEGSETIKIVVNSRSPYLVNQIDSVQTSLRFITAVLFDQPIIYSSHSVLPELPPPILT